MLATSKRQVTVGAFIVSGIALPKTSIISNEQQKVEKPRDFLRDTVGLCGGGGEEDMNRIWCVG